jgi:hemoglobin
MSVAEVMVKPSLYEELGGAPAIAAVVEEFYARVLGDATLAPMFDGVDMAKQKRHQVQFIVFALGGPNQYRGRTMRRAHTGLSITEAQFGAVAGHLGDALAVCGVPPLMIASVIDQVAQLKGDVVGL